MKSQLSAFALNIAGAAGADDVLWRCSGYLHHRLHVHVRRANASTREAAATVTTLTLPVPAQGSAQQSDHDAACWGVPGPDVASGAVSVCVCACVVCILLGCVCMHSCKYIIMRVVCVVSMPCSMRLI